MKSNENIITFTSRMPENIISWLDKRAADNMRSRNRELLFILESIKEEERRKCGV